MSGQVKVMESDMTEPHAVMRPVVGFGVALLVALALTPSAKAEDLKVWRQAMIAPKADAGFFLMAARRGFAIEAGLKLETIDVKDDQVGMRALISGDVDSFDSATGAVIAAARGADVRIVGCPWLAAPYVLLARPGITRVEELKGKTIAASAPGTPPDIVARASLSTAQVGEEQVKFAAIGGDRDRYTALIGGVVDAAVVANEYLPMRTSKDLSLLAEAKQVLPQWVRFCTLVNARALSERHEVAARFLGAEIKAFRFAASHRAETIKLTQEVTDAAPDDPRPAYVFDQAVQPGVLAPDFPLPVENLTWMRDKLAALGQIPKADLTRAIDAGLRLEALERAGK
jgi:NitT/TauT family transport system substrate-binding protein